MHHDFHWVLVATKFLTGKFYSLYVKESESRVESEILERPESDVLPPTPPPWLQGGRFTHRFVFIIFVYYVKKKNDYYRLVARRGVRARSCVWGYSSSSMRRSLEFIGIAIWARKKSSSLNPGSFFESTLLTGWGTAATARCVSQQNIQNIFASQKIVTFCSFFPQALQYLQKVCNHPLFVLTSSHPHYTRFMTQLKSSSTSLHDIKHAAKLPALKQLLLDCGIGGKRLCALCLETIKVVKDAFFFSRRLGNKKMSCWFAAAEYIAGKF